jgi:hypothetical protein
LGGPEDAELVFPLILKPDVNLVAVVAVLDILSAGPEQAEEVVAAYLAWRTSLEDVPQLDQNPDKALVGFSLFSEPSQSHLEAAKAVAVGLARCQAELQEVSSRTRAESLLRQLLREELSAPIDPQADAETRSRQLQRWLEWWQEVEPDLELSVGRLGRDSDRR